MNLMFCRAILLLLVVAVAPVAFAVTNSLATAYTVISTYRSGPVASEESGLFTSPAGLMLTIR